MCPCGAVLHGDFMDHHKVLDLAWQMQCLLLRAAGVSAMSALSCVRQKEQHSPTEPERFHTWAGAVAAAGSAEGMLLATASW